MIIKENIYKDAVRNNSIGSLHDFVVKLGFDLHKKSCVKYFSNEIKLIQVTDPKKRTRNLIEHFSARNRNFKINKLAPWRQNYLEFLKVNMRDNLAMFQHSKAKMILLDIDCHNKAMSEENLKLTALNIVDEFRTIFNNPNFSPGIVEISKRKRGIHMYIPIDCEFQNESVEFFLSNYKKYFEENNKGFILEWRTPTKAVRLPFTVDYSVFRWENDKLIRTSFSNKNKISSFPLSIDKANLTLENIYGKRKIIIFERESTISNKTPIDFSMYRGDRVIRHLALARYCHKRNISYSEYLSMCNEWNKGSKDLTYSFQKTCKSVWDSTINYSTTNTTTNTTTTSSFISNLSLLSGKDRRFIKRILRRNSKHFSHASRYTLGKDIEIFCQELFGYMYFQDKKPRYLRKQARITKKKREEMCIGYQFPINLQDMIIEHYNLKSNRKNLFKLFCTFFMEQYKHNTRGWSEGCCRQWKKKKRVEVTNYYMEYFFSFQKNVFQIPLQIHNIKYDELYLDTC